MRLIVLSHKTASQLINDHILAVGQIIFSTCQMHWKFAAIAQAIT